MSMRIILMGSVSSSWHALSALIQGGVEVVGVLGVDESRAARISNYVSLEPLARSANIPFHSFGKVSEPKVDAFVSGLRPDMLWVIGLSQLVPDSLIGRARLGGVGYHPTLLPRGRGRAPIAWTLLRDEDAAANLFFLTDEPDAGDLIMQRKVPAKEGEYAYELIERTNQALREGLMSMALDLQNGKLPRIPQNHDEATCYPKRTPLDGIMDWNVPAERLVRFVRAVGRPYPGSYSYLNGQKLVVWQASIIDEGFDPTFKTSPGAAGTVIGHDLEGNPIIAVSSGDERVRLEEIEFESGRPVPLPVGTRLESFSGGCWDDPEAQPPRLLLEGKL